MNSKDEFGRLLKLDAGAPLTEKERLIGTVGQFAIGVEMGGLSGYLYNVSPDASSSQNEWVQLREATRLLNLVGALGAANLLGMLVARLEASALDDGTWSGFLEARGVDLDVHEHEVEGYDELFRLLDDHLAKSA
jgi:hypothetical protein